LIIQRIACGADFLIFSCEYERVLDVVFCARAESQNIPAPIGAEESVDSICDCLCRLRIDTVGTVLDLQILEV
jgi:hypothetical protein